MLFIGVHIVLVAITLWLYLHRHMFSRGEYWPNMFIVILIHILLFSIYFWYFHVHDDGYKFYRWIGKLLGIYNEYKM